MSQIEDDEYSLLANNQTVFVCPIQQATYQAPVSFTVTPIPLHILDIEIIQTEDMTMPIFL